MDSITSFLIKCMYIMLPGIFANIAPIVFRNYFKKLAIPIDLYKKYKGKRILGNNKTFRGLIFGIIFSTTIVYIQTLLYNYSLFQAISFINYEYHNFLVLGFLIGFGVIFGDLVESFIKRRVGIAPGKPFIPWDQIDSAIGSIIFGSILYKLDFIQITTIMLLSFLLSILFSRIGHILHFRKEKW